MSLSLLLFKGATIQFRYVTSGSLSSHSLAVSDDLLIPLCEMSHLLPLFHVLDPRRKALRAANVACLVEHLVECAASPAPDQRDMIAHTYHPTQETG